MAETRKLAAILAADVAGYSKLASADEERTLARLRALRSDLIYPTIAVHNGRVVKRTGDGGPLSAEGAGHRRHQDWGSQIVLFAKCGGAREVWML